MIQPFLNLDIQSNIKQVSKTLTRFQKQAIPKATVSTLNQLAKEANTVGKRELSKAMGFPAKNFKGSISLIKANKNSLTSAIKARNRAFNLARFNAKQTKKGVRAKAWGAPKVYKGAFIAKAGKTVFARTSDKRLPIKALSGPSLSKEFINATVNGAMKRKINDRFVPLFVKNINFHLSRLR